MPHHRLVNRKACETYKLSFAVKAASFKVLFKV